LSFAECIGVDGGALVADLDWRRPDVAVERAGLLVGLFDAGARVDEEDRFRWSDLANADEGLGGDLGLASAADGVGGGAVLGIGCQPLVAEGVGVLTPHRGGVDVRNGVGIAAPFGKAAAHVEYCRARCWSRFGRWSLSFDFRRRDLPPEGPSPDVVGGGERARKRPSKDLATRSTNKLKSKLGKSEGEFWSELNDKWGWAVAAVIVEVDEVSVAEADLDGAVA